MGRHCGKMGTELTLKKKAKCDEEKEGYFRIRTFIHSFNKCLLRSYYV
jgi:hypothetical protein